jgi:hypothetical protein
MLNYEKVLRAQPRRAFHGGCQCTIDPGRTLLVDHIIPLFMQLRGTQRYFHGMMKLSIVYFSHITYANSQFVSSDPQRQRHCRSLVSSALRRTDLQLWFLNRPEPHSRRPAQNDEPQPAARCASKRPQRAIASLGPLHLGMTPRLRNHTYRVLLQRSSAACWTPRTLPPCLRFPSQVRNFARPARETSAGTTTPVPDDAEPPRSRPPFYFEAGYALFAKRPSRPFPPPFLSLPSTSFSEPLSTHNKSRDRRPRVNGEMIRGVTNGDDAVLVSENFIGANDGVGAWATREKGHAAYVTLECLFEDYSSLSSTVYGPA